MLNWIIFVLTLCTSIMSVVHGVFIVLGALPVSNGASPALPQTIVSMMPIISAVIALLGGIFALRRSKISILFLFAATLACAFASQDVWLYGGAYFFSAVLCFFLSKKNQDDYLSNYYLADGEFSLDPDAELPFDENSAQVFKQVTNTQQRPSQQNFQELDDDDIRDFRNTDSVLDSDSDSQNDLANHKFPEMTSEPQLKIRGRTSKSCPTCGNIVARDVAYCPNCGTKLYVDPTLSGNDESKTSAQKPDLEQNLKLEAEQKPDINLNLNLNLDHELELEHAQAQEQEQEPVTQHAQEMQMQTQELLLRDLEQNSRANSAYENFGEEMPTSISGLLDGSSGKSAKSEYNNRRGKYNSYNSNDNENESESESDVYKVSSANFAQRNRKLSNDAKSYQQFSNSKYKRRGKKRTSSAIKRIFMIMMLVIAVVSALYFLLGLRKLPPGDLPPIARDEVIPQNRPIQEEDVIAQPVSENSGVKENILPNFTPDENPKNGVLTGNGVNMRADHSLVARSITKLSNGTRFEILDSWTGQTGTLSGTWYQVRTSNGREGWVYGRYVQLAGAGLPTGYANALVKSFGSNREELVESLGQPTRSTATSAEWQGLTATLRGSEITRIRVTSSNRELQNGLKTGINQESLFQILGYPSSRNTQQRTVQYNEDAKAAISVQLDRNNNVTAITVNQIQ